MGLSRVAVVGRAVVAPGLAEAAVEHESVPGEFVEHVWEALELLAGYEGWLEPGR